MPGETPQIDPEMKAYADRQAERATQHPDPFSVPLEEARRAVSAVQLVEAEGGPSMVETVDRWIDISARRILVRCHYPVSERPLPALVYFHGGGWTWNSIDTHDRVAREYAAAAGIAVVMPNYSLSPEYRYPLALNESVAVLRHLRAHGREIGVDPERLAVGGDSAGGNLAMAVALRLRDAGEAWLKAALLNYGVFDASLDTPSCHRFAEGFGLTRERMRWFWGNYLGAELDTADNYAAPAKADLHALPAMRFVVAECDVLADENRALHERAVAAGLNSTKAEYTGMLHGFLRGVASIATARRAIDDTSAWLRETLHR